MSERDLLLSALSLGLSLVLGGVFLAAALPKLRHPKGFLLTVIEYRILGEGASRLYALVVPPVELLAALLLFAGVAVRPTALLLVLLLLSFLVGIGANLARGRDLECGCFGHGNAKNGNAKSRARRIGPGLVVQDLGLLAAALLLAAVMPGWLEPAPWAVWSAAWLLARLVGIPAAVALVLAGCLALTAWLTLQLRRTKRPTARAGRKRPWVAAEAEAEAGRRR